MSRQIDVSAAEFATVRAVLGVSQGAFALRLGIARRTVIRGEQRGIELPSRYGTQASDGRKTLRETWEAARKEAEANPAKYAEVAASEPVAAILAKMGAAPSRARYAYGSMEANYSVSAFREHVKQVAGGDTSPRGKVAPGKKRKKKLARRMKK